MSRLFEPVEGNPGETGLPPTLWKAVLSVNSAELPL